MFKSSSTVLPLSKMLLNQSLLSPLTRSPLSSISRNASSINQQPTQQSTKHTPKKSSRLSFEPWSDAETTKAREAEPLDLKEQAPRAQPTDALKVTEEPVKASGAEAAPACDQAKHEWTDEEWAKLEAEGRLGWSAEEWARWEASEGKTEWSADEWAAWNSAQGWEGEWDEAECWEVEPTVTVFGETGVWEAQRGHTPEVRGEMLLPQPLVWLTGALLLRATPFPLAHTGRIPSSP